MHDRDALVPLDETLRALDDLVTQGKVRHIGVCNFSAADLERAVGITSRTDRAHVVSNQVRYSLTSRDIEHEIMPVAASNKMGLLVWSPLAGGYLSGKSRAEWRSCRAACEARLSAGPIWSGREPILAVLREVADELAATPAQVSLGWLLAREQITSVIVGARTCEQLAANLDAQNLRIQPPNSVRGSIKYAEPSVPLSYWMQRLHDRDRICG